MLRGMQLVLAVAGAILLGALVHAVGIATIAEALRRVGAGFVVVLALELLLDACNTRGWQQALPRSAHVGFWRLFFVRQAGTAINQLTPTGGVGGELVKGLLLRDRMRARDAAASVIVAKLALALAQALLVVLGLGVVVRRLEGRPELAAGMLAAATLVAIGLGMFYVAQRRGWMARLIAVAVRLVPDGRMARWLGRAGGAIDGELRAFWSERPAAFAAVVAWHVAGQVVSVGQLWFILHALGMDTDLVTCLAVEAALLLADAATFFVPGRVGVHEGGRVLVFSALGLGAATGLAVALVVRITQLAVSATGLAAFAYFSWTSTPLADSISGS